MDIKASLGKCYEDNCSFLGQENKANQSQIPRGSEWQRENRKEEGRERRDDTSIVPPPSSRLFASAPLCLWTYDFGGAIQGLWDF